MAKTRLNLVPPSDQGEEEAFHDNLAGQYYHRDVSPLQPEVPVVQATAVDSSKSTESKSSEPSENPFDKAGVLSMLSLWYLNPLLARGAKEPLRDKDVPNVPVTHSVDFCRRHFEPAWRKLQNSMPYYDSGPRSAMLFALLLSTSTWMLQSMVAMALYVLGQLVTPSIVRAIIKYAAGSTTVTFWGVSDGYVFVVLLLAATIVSLCALTISFVVNTRSSCNMRVAAMDAVYRKALLLSNSARQSSTVGEMVTLMSVDCERLFHAVYISGWLYSGPIVVLVAYALLANFLGVSALSGAAVLVVVLGVQGYLAEVIGSTRQKVVEATQERVKLINESLLGIRVMKFSAWEGPISERVEEARKTELKHLRFLGYVEAVNMAILFISPVVVMGVIFLTYYLTGGVLDVSVVFTTFAYISVMRLPLEVLPASLSAMIEGYVASRRLEKFLRHDELNSRGPGEEGLIEKKPDVEVGTIEISGADFYWCNPAEESSNAATRENIEESKDPSIQEGKGNVVILSPVTDGPSTPIGVGVAATFPPHPALPLPVLSNVNLHVRPGALCMVVGSVGSGKTALVQSLLGQLHQASGRKSINGSFAYVPQEPWIFHGTVRENIVFHSEFESARYKAAIRASQLQPDLSSLTMGDLTEIGERGINLSGGQKARVSLARAIYRQESDIVLLDDPLSAVDSRVAKLIFEQAVLKLLAGKTRVLVVNSHYHFLTHADVVVIIEKGKLAGVGSPEELKSSFPAYFSRSSEDSDLEEEGELAKQAVAQVFGGHKAEERPHSVIVESSSTLLQVRCLEERQSVSTCSVEFQSHLMPVEGEGQLVAEEEQETGAVTLATYAEFFGSSGKYGVWVAVLILFGFVLAQVSRTLTDWWFSVWSQFKIDSFSDLDYLYVYAGLAVLTAVITLARAIVFINTTISVSHNVHEMTYRKVLRAPITTFFDITPLGRILNRFSKDMDQIDTFLPEFLLMLLQNALMVIGILVVCSIASWYFLAALIPICFVYFYADKYYRKSSREMKRLESISRSPIFVSFAETLTGLSTIRAFKMEETFIEKNRKAVDDNNKHFFVYWMSSRWLAFRLDLLGALVTLLIGIFAVAFRSSQNPGLVALALIYSLQLMGLLQWTVRNSVMVENSMTSAERILHYKHLESEAEEEIPATKPVESWPASGRVVFTSVHMRYRPELSPVLKGLSFEVKPREKIGICGRTGAGKSSIMMALFRIVEIEAGSIVIDDIDISKIGLKDLRSRLAIIPQDPVMFTGSLRYNLDPFQQYSDSDIWEALRRVHLASEVESMPTKLESMILEGGDNLSLGQRQLICIGRAILKKTQILVMDEATASVDTVTDSLIQETIRINFVDRTVLCIAHRLDTIIDSDRILVISDGKVAEFDEPSALLSNPQSHFSGLVNELGEDTRKALHDKAAKTTHALP